MIGLFTTFAALAVAAAQAEGPAATEVTQGAEAVADCYKQMVQFDDVTTRAGVIASAMVSACAKQIGPAGPAQMRKLQSLALTAVLRARNK